RCAPPCASSRPLPDALPIFPFEVEYLGRIPPGVGHQEPPQLEDQPYALRQQLSRFRQPVGEDVQVEPARARVIDAESAADVHGLDRQSTRLNSSHVKSSYAG